MSVERMGEECESMTLMEVNDLVNEAAVKAYCRNNDIDARTCRWVCVQKDKHSVKMRTIVRKLAKRQKPMHSMKMSSQISTVEPLKSC